MDAGLLTIGEFARAARLSPKALRLYDELGLLTPARVDPSNGYRRYAPAQLEQARLVACLRRLGMPLARIREVCALAPGAAAEAVAGYWARAEADTAARRDLAAFLVDELTRKDTAMTSSGADNGAGSGEGSELTLRSAALSDRGLVREAQQDAVHAGARLLAVADGHGSGGAGAAAAAIGELAALEAADEMPGGDPLAALEEAGRRAHRAAPGPEGGTGTTLTALFRDGARLALLHIGDSRAYVLRDSGLFRITQDHSVVQSLIDEGRLTPEEVPSHPQRSLLLRTLDGGPGYAPDLQPLRARPGERYLLCTDGLTSVVADAALREVLTTAAGPGDAAADLVALARRAGAPDNVGVAVADVVTG